MLPEFHPWADIAYYSALAELFRPQIKTSSIPFECGWVALLSVFEIGMCFSLCHTYVHGADVGLSRCCHQCCCEWTSNALSRKKRLGDLRIGFAFGSGNMVEELHLYVFDPRAMEVAAKSHIQLSPTFWHCSSRVWRMSVRTPNYGAKRCIRLTGSTLQELH